MAKKKGAKHEFNFELPPRRAFQHSALVRVQTCILHVNNHSSVLLAYHDQDIDIHRKQRFD